MDFHEFDTGTMYFEAELPPAVQQLLELAAKVYPAPEAADALDEANRLAGDHLSVLVARYRYFYYQHRLGEAKAVAESALSVSGARLGFGASWMSLVSADVERAFRAAPTLTRFYLLALKGWGYLSLRLGDWDGALAAFLRLTTWDESDRLGVRFLLQMARRPHSIPA